MAQIITRNIKSTASKDLLNAIRNSASVDYKNYVPVVNNANSVKDIGNIIMSYVPLQNEFISNMVNRIITVWVQSKAYRNPWSFFSKGELELGESIEQVWVDILQPFQFDPALAEKQIFKREAPNVQAVFHYINSKLFYKVTIEREQLRAAFVTENGLENMVTKIVEQLATSEQMDEFEIMKYLIARHILDGHFYPISIPTISGDNARAITAVIKEASDKILFPSRLYNPAGVKNFTAKDNQYLISNAYWNSNMDVNVLSTAFNMEKSEFMGHRVLVDGFDVLDNERLAALIPNFTPLTDAELEALKEIPSVLVDGDWMVFVTNLREMRDTPNGEGLYWQYWYHVWKTFSMSPFSNAIVFVPGQPEINSVSVSPSAVTQRAGTSIMFTATVDTNYFASKAVKWTTDNEAVTISAEGIAYIPADVPNGTVITATATSVYDNTKTATATITVSDGSGGGGGITVTANPNSVEIDNIENGQTYTRTVALSGATKYFVDGVTLDITGGGGSVAGLVEATISGSTLTLTLTRGATDEYDGVTATGTVNVIGVDTTSNESGEVAVELTARFQG